MKKSLLFFCACAYALTSVPAYGIPLGVLELTNGTIQSGDKIFTNFGFSSLASTSPQQASDIDVIPVTVGGNHGLRFVGPFFGTTSQVGSTIFIELGFYDFNFDVMTTDPNVLIHDVSQSWAFTHFGEGFRNFAVHTTGQNCADIFCSGPGEFDDLGLHTSLHGVPFMEPVIPSPGILSSTAILPFDSPFLRLENDVFIGAGSINDPIATLHPTFVSVPFVEFTFSQTTAVPKPVPEPSTLLLFGSAFALVQAVRFRSHRRRVRRP